MKISHCLLASLLCIFAVSGESFAQSSVDSRVQRLEEIIQNLERRVASLEAQLRERSSPISVPSGKESWRKLKSGMSEGDVEQLLGSPSKINAFGSFSVWYYENPSGERGLGRVQFDSKGKVDGWSEP